MLRKNDSDEVVGVAKWSLFTHADPEEAVSKFWVPGQAKSLLIKAGADRYYWRESVGRSTVQGGKQALTEAECGSQPGGLWLAGLS